MTNNYDDIVIKIPKNNGLTGYLANQNKIIGEAKQIDIKNWRGDLLRYGDIGKHHPTTFDQKWSLLFEKDVARNPNYSLQIDEGRCNIWRKINIDSMMIGYGLLYAKNAQGFEDYCREVFSAKNWWW